MKSSYFLISVAIFLAAYTQNSQSPNINLPTNNSSIQSLVSPTIPSQEITTSFPNCERKKYYTNCTDEVINIQFEYPSEWGKITAFFRQGGIGGNLYWYQFSGASEKTMQVYAGGRSQDFSEGREPILTDFSGFSENNGFQCGSLGYSFCKEIKPGVILEVLGGSGENFCSPYPIIHYPKTVIWINLPRNSTITGFAIVGDFLADQKTNEFKNVFESEETGLACNREKVQIYNDKSKELIRSVWKRDLDPQSKERLKELLYVARSIKLK